MFGGLEKKYIMRRFDMCAVAGLLVCSCLSAFTITDDAPSMGDAWNGLSSLEQLEAPRPGIVKSVEKSPSRILIGSSGSGARAHALGT